MDPLELSRQQAAITVTEAARKSGCLLEPDPEAFRFRPDGKGGEWATPFPLIARVLPETLSSACPENPWIEEVFPSGGWLGIQLSDRWRSYVRSYVPNTNAAAASVTAPPEFPAAISPASWAFQSLLPKPDAALAARLDTGNPYRRLLWALRRSETHREEGKENRPLLNECALLAHFLEGESPSAVARQSWKLAQLYLAAPAEDATVARLLTDVRKFLSI